MPKDTPLPINGPMLSEPLNGHTPLPWNWKEGTPDVSRPWNGIDVTLAQVKRPDWHEDSNCASKEAGNNAAFIAHACNTYYTREAQHLSALRTIEQLREALKAAAIRLGILTGRMRSCHQETGKHELLEEAEDFEREAWAALGVRLPEEQEFASDCCGATTSEMANLIEQALVIHKSPGVKWLFLLEDITKN